MIKNAITDRRKVLEMAVEEGNYGHSYIKDSNKTENLIQLQGVLLSDIFEMASGDLCVILRNE